jgi:uncharacterized membrane protein
MTALTVWKFSEADGAEHAWHLLQGAERDHLIEVLDHAIITWPADSDQPRLMHGREGTGRAAGKGAIWGLLAGALFTVPVLGAAAGATIAAGRKSAERLGISQEQLDTMRDELTQGTSALFLVSEAGNLDRVGERLRGVHMTLVQTNLTPAERSTLLETFGS